MASIALFAFTGDVRVLLFYGAIAALIALYYYFFGWVCPRCNRKWALERTGETEGDGWFKVAREEWRCKYCGCTVWKDRGTYHGGS
jgi:hypothetical protein